MNEAVEKLFHYARAEMTEQDIRNFSPSDPGYGNYVELWTKIWRTGEVPEKSEFDLSEVIRLTHGMNAEESVDPRRFRAYRRFTRAVALALIHSGNSSERVLPVNYLAHDLIIDLDSSDQKHLCLLREVFPPTREVLIAMGDEDEYLYFTFGMLILAQRAKDWEDAANASAMLIADENAVRAKTFAELGMRPGQFLLGQTYFDDVQEDWIAWSRQLSNPQNDENIRLVMDALIRSSF